jgi:hypothetical protein
MLVHVSEGTWSKCIVNANEIPIKACFSFSYKLSSSRVGNFVCLYVVVCGGACAAAVTTCGLDHLECPRMSDGLK